ncbi:MAG: ABC transporter ATP-binding protein [Spirochaetaceae bacterium]|nr:ABC transporter ATP-binding protein [Spirochaetaceae bacterium]
MNDSVALKLENVYKAFSSLDGKFIALEDINLTCLNGSTTLITGENGSGKSLLMLIASKLIKPDKGTVFSSSKVGLVFQDADTQILGETVAEDVSFGLKNLGLKKDEIAKKVETALKKTGLCSKSNFSTRFLSGGEKRKLAVACILAMNLSIIIFDEPYANLDYGGIKQVNNLIKELKEEGKTIIILTHELEKCLGLADKLVVLFRGHKVFEGTPEESLCQPLENWNIKNPKANYNFPKDMIW